MAETSIQTLGFAATLKKADYPERKPVINQIEPLDFDSSETKCAPRNIMVRAPSKVGIFPSEFFQLVFFKKQGLHPPLTKFCTPVAVGTAVPAFWFDETDASLRYTKVLQDFNKKNKDINEHCFLKDVLDAVWIANGFPLTNETLTRDTADDAYLVHAHTAMQQWEKALKQNKHVLLISTLESEVATVDNSSMNGNSSGGGHSLMKDIGDATKQDKTQQLQVAEKRKELASERAAESTWSPCKKSKSNTKVDGSIYNI